MTVLYPTTRNSFRDQSFEPPTFSDRLQRAFHLHIRPKLQTALNEASARLPRHSFKRFQAARRKWNYHTFLNIPNILALLWMVLIWWGERHVFDKSIEACNWNAWESWPEVATPHHVIFIADPQLIDPHTYPGRPWPISSLTVFYTDLYLRRSYKLLQQQLHPDTVIFLGDLFDGGREWSTGSSESPEERWRKYGPKFWLKEYDRFHKIFSYHWNDGGVEPGNGQPGRKLIASLPGNHDLGLGNDIQLPVRKRFTAMFGYGNRVDVIGNHTFVSIDSPSLTAKGQLDFSTGNLKDDENSSQIWGPTEAFLDSIQVKKRRMLDQQLRLMNGEKEREPLSSVIYDVGDVRPEKNFDPDVGDLPNILLTHIPLYRDPDTPCTSLRESRRSILIQAGYRYQNVLTPANSNRVIDAIGNVQHVFSGDDHDYCEVVHNELTGAPREITVKSISFAMGVRKPGFQMATLWNPIDNKGYPIGGSRSASTLQTQMCLLPDQLSIFIGYAQFFGFTLFALVVHTLWTTRFGTNGPPVEDEDESTDPLLPLSNPHDYSIPPAYSSLKSSAENEKAHAAFYSTNSPNTNGTGDGNVNKSSRTTRARATSLSTNSNESSVGNMLVTRGARGTSTPRSDSPNHKLGGYGLIQYATNANPSTRSNSPNSPNNGRLPPMSPIMERRSTARGMGHASAPIVNHKPGKVRVMLKEFVRSSKRMGCIAGFWYLWTIWTG
ncbi:MAG: hypothetical protein M1834_001620 [Cirrosporium novae-zelandiae]|nr:MAG: hypothetical protein M1834_004137 [Cirrosporium novae-zelandiae]KAI9735604.1 MAG: hypothetical protein M1834_001620 [Cirrosporium novae-zelandiae]